VAGVAERLVGTLAATAEDRAARFDERPPVRVVDLKVTAKLQRRVGERDN